MPSQARPATTSPKRRLGTLAGAALVLLGMLAPALNGCDVLLVPGTPAGGHCRAVRRANADAR